MIRKIIIATLLIFQLIGECFAQAEYPFGTIMKRVYDDEVIKTSSNDAKAKALLKTLNEDGAWSDVDYKTTSITEWDPYKHFERLKVLISAYVFGKSSLYQNKSLKKNIDNALTYWANNEFRSSNWWHNDIAVPKAIGVSLILMNFGQEKVDRELIDLLVFKMIQGDPYTKTGANKSDIAMHYFYRALITQDKSLLGSSIEQLFFPVKIVDDEEGLQHDFSYLQHGPQLYIAGYGEEFMKGISKVMSYVRETPYAISSDKLQLFSTFVKNTYLPIIRSKYIDFNVHGRGVTRPNILKKNGETAILKQMLLIDPAQTKVWNDGIQKLDSTIKYNAITDNRHTHFWKGDYSIHLRKNYHFTVRMASDRTNKSEAGNEENIYGKHMTDGVTNIQVYGPEYYNIFPLWEWDKIPGTTTRDLQTDEIYVDQWGVPALNKFAGGVSHKDFGVSAMKVDYDQVLANKAWFFFDKQIVCLGSGITSTSQDPVVTTLNQTWLKDKVFVNNKSINKADSIVQNLLSGSTIAHNSVLYYLPNEANVAISTKEQTGTWYNINRARIKDLQRGNLFKAWINHGVKPKDEKYAYIVYPGMNKYDAKEGEQVVILENSTRIQGAMHKGLGIIQAVIYEAGTYTLDSVTITVDKSIIVQILKKGDVLELSVADPYQIENNSINIHFKDDKSSINENVKIELPTGAFRGETKTISLGKGK